MPAPKGNQYAKGHGYGRPKKFTKEFIENEAKALEEWMKKEDSIFLKSFAIERGYHPDEFVDMEKDNEIFSRVYKKCKQWQEQKLLNYALFNKINAGFTKFVLVNHHNYVSEKQQVNMANPADLQSLQKSIEKTAEKLKEDANESDL